jgi:hypothetical protein
MGRALLAVVLVLLAAASPSSARLHAGPALRLTAIPDVATVYWRYDCTTRQPRWALGLTVDRDAATTDVHLREGHTTAILTMQPAQTHWFPFSSSVGRTLTTVQAIEPGTLRAVLTVDFGFPHGVTHCWPYAPPRLTLEVYPR